MLLLTSALVVLIRSEAGAMPTLMLSAKCTTLAPPGRTLTISSSAGCVRMEPSSTSEVRPVAGGTSWTVSRSFAEAGREFFLFNVLSSVGVILQLCGGGVLGRQ